MDERTKEITVGNRRYRLNKMTPLVAVRIHNWIVAGAARLSQGQNGNAPQDEQPQPEGPEARANGLVVSVWVMASTLFSEELAEKVQVYCLRSCSQYPETAESPDAPPLPVMTQDARWVAKELESDPIAVNQLVLAALKFNISPFFTANMSSSASGA